MKKVILFLLIIVFSDSCKEETTFRESYEKNHYKGIIIKIYRDPDNHEVGTFTVKTDSSKFEEIADFYSESWFYAKVGDSIIKPIDTLMIIIKKNDSIYQEFFMDQRFLE